MDFLKGKKIYSIGIAAASLLVYLWVAPKLVRKKEMNTGASPIAVPMGGTTAALTPIPVNDIVSLAPKGPSSYDSMRFGGRGRRSMTAMRKVTIS